MNLIRKGHGHAHRGVIGIESAIVLIAFVIVAAALAFVVLNMGFATTQKAKTSITAALGEAGSSIQVSGKVVGDARTSVSPLTSVTIPMKITSGGENVDLNYTRATISYISDDIEYDNIYRITCTLTGVTYANASAAWAAAAVAPCINTSPILGAPSATTAIIYWAVSQTPINTILEQGEHAILSIAWDAGDEPASLEKIKIELTVTGGATLTVKRDIPNISSRVIDLG